MKEDFFEMAVYKTVRKSVGKGIWIADYKRALRDDAQVGVDSDSEENSRELLKKELQFVDNVRGSGSKKKLKLEPIEVNFSITNISDSY